MRPINLFALNHQVAHAFQHRFAIVLMTQALILQCELNLASNEYPTVHHVACQRVVAEYFVYHC